MIKNYTQEEYANKALEARKQKKMLYVLVENDEGNLVIAEHHYYVCYQDNLTDGTVNENWKQEQEQDERSSLDMLSLTKREVFLALLDDKGITPEQLRSQITDERALIEFDYANDYFRGNPLINTIGAMLGYTTEQLDYLFINKEFPATEPTEEEL